MTVSSHQLRALLRLVSSTKPKELDCDQVLQRAGALLESLGEGEGPPKRLAAVSQHLEVCPECREEFDALMRVYRRQADGEPACPEISCERSGQ